MSILAKIAQFASQPGALRRLFRGDSIEAISTPPAKLRRIENGSDDFYNQMQDASKAQSAHYAKLKAKHPENTPIPADILQELMEGGNTGRHLYEVMSPARGWTVVDPQSQYIAGILSEGKGPSITNPTLNALAREYRKPHATAATQELVDYYRSKGLTVDPKSWGMELAKGGLVRMKECNCGRT